MVLNIPAIRFTERILIRNSRPIRFIPHSTKATKAFARLTYFVELLNLDSPKDVIETWDSTTVRQLTADQVRKVLALREDFKRGEIDELALK